MSDTEVLSEPVEEKPDTAKKDKESTKDVGGRIAPGKNPQRQFYSFMLLLSCLTSADIAIADLVKAVSNMHHRGFIQVAFWRMRTLVYKWNFKVQDASKYISTMVPKGEFRQILERLSQALNAGMKLKDFNKVESTKYMIQYDSEYSRITDRLKQISEAFSAVLTSVSFLAVSILISNMTFSLGNPTTMLIATGAAIAGTLFVMTFLIRLYSPKEGLLHTLEHRPFGLDKFHGMNRTLQIIGMVIGFGLPALLFYLPIVGGSMSLALGVPLIAAGIPLFFFGRIAKKRVSQVKSVEEQYPPFIKNFGDAFTVSTSSKEAIRILAGSDYGKLNGPIARLNKRLNAGMSTDIAWELFVEECGSFLIQNHTFALHDSLALGARAARASDAVFKSFVASQGRRKKRELVSGFLRAIIIPLQMTFTGVLVLIQALVGVFASFAAKASQYLVLLHPLDTSLINYYVYSIVATTIFGTTFAMQLVEGESEYDFTYYLGLQMLLTGVIVIATATGAAALLSTLVASAG